MYENSLASFCQTVTNIDTRVGSPSTRQRFPMRMPSGISISPWLNRTAADPDRDDFAVGQIGFDFEATGATHLYTLIHRPVDRPARFGLQRR